MFRRNLLIGALALAVFSSGPGFAQDKEQQKMEKQKSEMRTRADAALQKLFKEVEGSKKLYDKAAGYAVISVTKAGFFVSGSGGSGVAVDKATKHDHLYEDGRGRRRSQFRRRAIRHGVLVPNEGAAQGVRLGRLG